MPGGLQYSAPRGLVTQPTASYKVGDTTISAKPLDNNWALANGMSYTKSTNPVLYSNAPLTNALLPDTSVGVLSSNKLPSTPLVQSCPYFANKYWILIGNAVYTTTDFISFNLTTISDLGTFYTATVAGPYLIINGLSTAGAARCVYTSNGTTFISITSGNGINQSSSNNFGFSYEPQTGRIYGYFWGNPSNSNNPSFAYFLPSANQLL